MQASATLRRTATRGHRGGLAAVPLGALTLTVLSSAPLAAATPPAELSPGGPGGPDGPSATHVVADGTGQPLVAHFGSGKVVTVHIVAQGGQFPAGAKISTGTVTLTVTNGARPDDPPEVRTCTVDNQGDCPPQPVGDLTTCVTVHQDSSPVQDGFLPDPAPQTQSFLAGGCQVSSRSRSAALPRAIGDPQTLDFTLHDPGIYRQVGLTLRSTGTSQPPVAGGAYQLCTGTPPMTATACPMGTAEGSATTGADGRLDFPGLHLPGDYAVVATNTPTGYASDPQPHAVKVPANTRASDPLDEVVVPLTLDPVPTLSDDSADTRQDTPVAVDVLANDDGHGLALTLRSATAPAHGTVTLEGTQQGQASAHAGGTAAGQRVRYTPAAGFSGTDAFTYDASSAGGRSTAHVTVTVAAAPRPPATTPPPPTTPPPSTPPPSTPPPTTAPPTTAPPTTAPAPSAEPTPAARRAARHPSVRATSPARPTQPSRRLAFTGAPTDDLIPLGLGLAGIGAVTLAVARRAHRPRPVPTPER